MAIKNTNNPGEFSGLGQAGRNAGFQGKISSGNLVSPVAFSRGERSLKRTGKPLDRKMGKRSMGR